MRAAAVVNGALVLAGTGATAVLTASAVAAGELAALVPAVLPAAFLLAGALGVRARSQHPGIVLLLGVGSFHLAAFAISEAWSSAGRPGGPGPWALTVLSVALFAAGFGCLALLLATYPEGRLSSRGLRLFATTCGSVITVVVLVELFLRDAVPVVLSRDQAAVAAPGGLPLVLSPLDPQPLLPVLVVAGVAVLVVRARRASPELRQRLEWAVLAGILLATALLGTPVALAVVPDGIWAVAFVATMSLVPFALLGGLVRHRMLDVDLLVVRTLARGVMVLVVLGLYACAAWTLGASGSAGAVASVLLTLAAALTGRLVLRRAEDLADRWFTGGRVRRQALVAELARTLAASDAERLPGRICATLREGLDVSWIRLALDAGSAEAGQPSGEAAVSHELLAGGQRVGTLDCGPRRGGWGRAELARLEQVASHVAFALRDRELSRELEARVQELTTSRARLVRAEETVRRQVERDLHDGVQQQLVALLARLSVVRELLDPTSAAAVPLEAAHDLARDALGDLRRLVSGIHPALLGDRGLVAAVGACTALLPIAVSVDADPRVLDHRFAPEVEGAAFFVVSEALANVMKHSGSGHARVLIAPCDGGGLRVAVTDDGSGEASYDGTGLTGLRDRVEALGGRFLLRSTYGVGTTVVAEFVDASVLAASDA